MTRHFAFSPQTHILAAGRGVKVRSLTVTQVLFPLAVVSVAIGVMVHAVAFSHVINPRAFVLGPVQVDERSLAVLFILRIVANVATAIFKSKKLNQKLNLVHFLMIMISS
jgi:hypothetical protein